MRSGKPSIRALKGVAMPTRLLPPISIRTDNKSAVMEEKAAVTGANRLLLWPTVSHERPVRDAFPASNRFDKMRERLENWHIGLKRRTLYFASDAIFCVRRYIERLAFKKRRSAAPSGVDHAEPTLDPG